MTLVFRPEPVLSGIEGSRNLVRNSSIKICLWILSPLRGSRMTVKSRHPEATLCHLERSSA